MANVCTVSDSKYLIQGLALYESLRSKTENIVLHYLCLDDESYLHLLSQKNDSLKVYHVNSFLEKDSQLSFIKSSNYKYFCWTLASYFTNELLNFLNEDVTYIDSDVYFHVSFDDLLKEIGDKQVAIFRHRQFDLSSNRPEGLFNVGVVHFKNEKVSKKLLKWWANAVLFQKYPELTTCGDQKYLDKFPDMCPKDKIFIDGNVGHGAPWQWQLYDMSDYLNSGEIIWEGKRQKLFFTHFSQFVMQDDSYIPSAMHHVYTPLEMYAKNEALKSIYDEYFKKLKKVA